jgi:hypothetical protein
MAGARARRSPVCRSGKVAHFSGTGPARSGKDFLDHGENHRRRDQQAQYRNRGRDPGQRKDAAEDEELADKAVESWKSQG